MDLNAFVNEHAGPVGPADFAASRRNQIDEKELRARLSYYERNTPGFEATEEHMQVLSAVFTEHRHVFVTGGAGVGKTTFVKSVLIQELDYRNLHWAVTATTGIAGSHLEGKTLHSFFGIGLGPDWPAYYPRRFAAYYQDMPADRRVPRPQEMKKDELEAWYRMFYDDWLKNPKIKDHMRNGVRARLRSHEIVMIDEVSMLHGDGMLGYLDFMLKEIRDDKRPFGGLQMIFIGDFAQLPPVEESRDDEADPERSDWAFLSHAWSEANVKPIELTKVFRQGDVRFIDFLNNIRRGKMTYEDREYASQFVRNDMRMEETRFYTFLVPTNDQARRINLSALEQYPGPSIPLTAEFFVVPGLQRMKDWETRDVEGVKTELEKALRRRLLDKTSFVRIGYPVMFTVNDPDGMFVNGTRGFVREVNINPRNSANNRADTDNVVVGVPDKDGGEERLITLYRRSFGRDREQDTHELVAVPPCWNEDPENQKLPEYISIFPSVRQFPLIPAVAITIHKSQGMSMDRAILALSRTFAPGHVYVGLSRLRAPSGMVLTEIDFAARVDPYVMEYYNSIHETPPICVPT